MRLVRTSYRTAARQAGRRHECDRQLRERAENIKLSELDRLLKKLERAEDDTARSAEITQAFDRLVNKLLHPPLASLRDDAASGHRQGLVDALKRLFQLGE